MSNDPASGNFRFVAERRQYGGLLALTGLCAVIQPLANIALVNGPDGPSVSDPGTADFWRFVGSCCLFAIGVCSVIVGYLEAVLDWGEMTHTALLIVLTQSAYIPYVSDMAAVGTTMVKDPPQFFLTFPDDPAGLANQLQVDETREVLFIGSVGIFGIFAYGFGFVGTIAFMQFAIHAFRKGKPEDRNADYFRTRLSVYSSLLYIGGLCQILLGSFATTFSTTHGKIDGGVLRVAMFVIYVPYLTIAVGSLQFLVGFWGFCRSCFVFVGSRGDYTFQACMALMWIIVLTCQDIVQIGLLPDDLLAPMAPTFAAMSFGILFMPAYLDHKMRNTPKTIDESYYFGPIPDEEQPMLSRPVTRGVPSSKKGKPLELRKVYVMEKPAVVDDDYYMGPNEEDLDPYRDYLPNPHRQRKRKKKKKDKKKKKRNEETKQEDKKEKEVEEVEEVVEEESEGESREESEDESESGSESSSDSESGSPDEKITGAEGKNESDEPPEAAPNSSSDKISNGSGWPASRSNDVPPPPPPPPPPTENYDNGTGGSGGDVGAGEV